MRFTVTLVVTALVAGAAVAQTNLGIVSIDNVDNQYTPGQLVAGCVHQVSIRYDFRNLSSSPPYWISANGFEVYSPDGADWGYLELKPGPLALGLPPSTAIHIRHFDLIGTSWVMTGNMGSDPAGGNTGPLSRAGAFMATPDFLGGGYAGGVDNGIAVILEFRSYIEDGKQGLTLCLDTNTQVIAWEWAAGATMDYPLWNNGLGSNGPRCWEVYYCGCAPEWCGADTAALTAGYCGGASFQLCATATMGSLTYRMLPPYDDGSLGTVNPTTGLWSLPPSAVEQGVYRIEFQVFDDFYIAEPCIPFRLDLTLDATGCDCCVGRVGDINGEGGDEPTISDISALIDHLFISGTALYCLEEADVNQSGGASPTEDDITISDIAVLIDYLFITGPENMTLPECL